MDTSPGATVALEGFGQQLRQLRAAANISQDELARRSGLSAAGVGALERATRRAPQPATVALLADALALSERERADLEQAAQRGRARTSTQRPNALTTTDNLPLQLTSFVGRVDQVEEITRRLGANRLVTMLGSGGVGKTRAALEVATHVAVEGSEEVRFVDLAPLTDGSLVISRIAGVLGIRLSGADDTPDAFARALKGRRVLLVLDNCEHLIVSVTATVRVLLQQCPQVKILTTTRERLGIVGEVVHRLPPLALPDGNVLTIAEARSFSALELFVQRAHWADPDITFTNEQAPILIDICRRLDGIPLAIELAAAQLATLGLEMLSRRLGSARGIRGLPDRQQTMRDTIAWSYNLLTDDERMLLRRLGVFSGGCTLAAAEIVCPENDNDFQTNSVAGLMASLADKSLVNAVVDGERMRYVLLDSTRAFARERLAEAEEEPVFFRRHAQWLATYGEQALQEYLSQPNLVWLESFFPEIDNVRTALDRTLRFGLDEDVLLAGQIAGRFRGLWLISGLFQECRRWMEAILGRIDDAQHPLVAADLLTALSCTLTGSKLLAVCDRLISVVRHMDDRFRLAYELVNASQRYCQAGQFNKGQAAIDESRQILLEERAINPSFDQSDRVALMLLLVNCELRLARGQYNEARADYQEAITFFEKAGDQFALILVLTFRAQIEFLDGDTLRAIQYSDEAARLADAISRASGRLAFALCINAGILLSIPDICRGEAAARRAFSVTSSSGDDELQLISVQNLAAIAIVRGRPQTGARLLGSIEAWRETAEYHRTPFEEATFKLLMASLHAQLGTATDMHIAQGRRLDWEVAAEEVLSLKPCSGASGMSS